MRTVALPRIFALVLIASCVLFAGWQSTTPASPPQTNVPAQEQPPNPSTSPPTSEPVQQPATQPQTSERGRQPNARPKVRQSPKEEAWLILETACTGEKTSDRTIAIRVLGLVPNDAKALKLAETALDDDKPDVRSAGAGHWAI